MPYYFTFKINNEEVFKTQLESIRCTEITKKGNRCKRQTVIGSTFCSTHLAYNHHLQIKESNIPNANLGLFAFDPLHSNSNEILFKKGTTIVKYQGEIIDRDELNNRYQFHTAPYAVKISNNRYEDGAKVRGVGSLANTKPNHNNAKLSISNKGIASLKATKNIRNHNEILVSYGPAFKLNEPDVTYSTTKK
jgi:hypothetical protein